MKKLFFTAIVMVAFSAVSMANTIEVKKTKVLVNKKSVAFKAMTCLDAWMPEYDDLRHKGYTDSQAISLANITYRKCLK